MNMTFSEAVRARNPYPKQTQMWWAYTWYLISGELTVNVWLNLFLAAMRGEI